MLQHDAQPWQTHFIASSSISATRRNTVTCRFLIASKEFNNSHNAFPEPPERYTTLYHLRCLCMRWSGTHATTEGCGAPKPVHYLHELRKPIKIHKLYVVMILKKLKWTILILHKWKGSVQRHHRKSRDQEGRSLREACLGKPRSRHSQWLMESKLMEQVPARKIKTDMEWWSLRILKGFRTQTTNWKKKSRWSLADECYFSWQNFLDRFF